VREIDGRIVKAPLDTRKKWPGPGETTKRIGKLYRELCAREATRSL
jgi:hypothetical protein